MNGTDYLQFPDDVVKHIWLLSSLRNLQVHTLGMPEVQARWTGALNDVKETCPELDHAGYEGYGAIKGWRTGTLGAGGDGIK